MKYRAVQNITHRNFLVLEQTREADLLEDCVDDICLSVRRSVLNDNFVSIGFGGSIQYILLQGGATCVQVGASNVYISTRTEESMCKYITVLNR